MENLWKELLAYVKKKTVVKKVLEYVEKDILLKNVLKMFQPSNKTFTYAILALYITCKAKN